MEQFIREIWALCKEHPYAMGAVASVGALLLKALEFFGVDDLLRFGFKRLYLWMGNSRISGTNVGIEYREEVTQSPDWLVVHNAGDVPAKNVDVDVLGDQTRSSTPKVRQDWKEKLPTDLLPGQECRLGMSPSVRAKPPYKIRVKWNDDQGPREKTEEIYK